MRATSSSMLSIAAALLCFFSVSVFGKTESVLSNVLNYGVSPNLLAGAKVGAPIPIKDPDGDVLEFSIVGGNTDDIFKVEKDTGQLLLNKRVPEDVVFDQFTLTVRASDGNGGDTNATVMARVYRGTCRVCAMILEGVHRHIQAKLERASGNNLEAQHIFKKTNVEGIIQDLCSDPTSLLSTEAYRSDCLEIGVKHAKHVAKAFTGNRATLLEGKETPKRTFQRILDLCSATFSLCPMDLDMETLSDVGKSKCKKCMAVADFLAVEHKRWHHQAMAEAAQKSGKPPHSMSVVELRAELKTHQVTTKGLKPDLIARVLKVRAESMGKKGAKNTRFISGGIMENLLESSCSDISFRHPPGLSSSMEHTCVNLLDDHLDEIASLFVEEGTTADMAFRICGSSIANQCSKAEWKEFSPTKYASPFFTGGGNTELSSDL